MFIDGTWDLGVKVQSANATDSGVIGSTNIINLGAAYKYFAGVTKCKLFYRFSVTQTTSLILSFLGDSNANLATNPETIASTGTLVNDETGTALADDATARFISGFMHIDGQISAWQYYGLWIVSAGTGNTVVAGDCYLVIDPQTNERWARQAAPA